MNIITQDGSTIRSVAISCLATLALALFGSPVLAQSSGNFAASIHTTQCTMNTEGGLPNSGALNNNGGGMLLNTFVKTPNSQFTTLLITPSLVTGLFTNTAVTQDMTSSAQTAAVKVYVTLDGQPVLPATAGSPGVIYDQRFQQLSADFFSQIATCSALNNCSVDLVLSTLSAHSFNFVATNVGGGVHPLQVRWEFECRDHTGTVVPCTQTYTANTAGACAGPGTVTVTQTKAFSQSGGVTVQ